MHLVEVEYAAVTPAGGSERHVGVEVLIASGGGVGHERPRSGGDPDDWIGDVDGVGEPVDALLHVALVDAVRGPPVLCRHALCFVEDFPRIESGMALRGFDERR